MRSKLFVLLVLLVPGQLFAQSSDFGIWVNRANYSSTGFLDPTEPDFSGTVKFAPSTGFGVSYNHYWSPNISTDFGAHFFRGTTQVKATGGGFNVTVDVGNLKLQQYSGVVQWHFPVRGPVAPYVGGGVAYVTGGRIGISGEGFTADSLHLDNKLTIVANGGATYFVTPRVGIGVDLKYAPYKSAVDATPGDPIQELKINPLSFSIGLRMRL